MTITIPSKVKRQIKQFDRKVQQDVNILINSLAVNPRPSSCIKIENENNMWRVRTGEYRIAYHILKDSVEIVRAAHRSKFYARKEL